MITYLLLSIIFLKCNTSPSTDKHYPKGLDFKKSYITIPHPDSVAYTVFSYKWYQGKPLYSILNQYTNTIEIYNIDKRTLLKRIPIGINDSVCASINTYHLHTPDSIFYLATYCLGLLDGKGNVVWQKAINADSAGHIPNVYKMNLGSTPLTYDSKNHTLFGGMYCSGCFQNSPSFYKTPIEWGYSIPMDSFFTLPVSYPNHYIDNYYGFMNLPSSEKNGCLHYYSYMSDSRLFIYNRCKDKLKVMEGNSIHQKYSFKALDTAAYRDRVTKLEHWTTSPYYLHLRYDPFNNRLYRFFSGGMSLTDESGLRNKFSDKPQYLQVFDSTYTLIDEIELERHKLGVLYSFATPDGFYISDKSSLNDTFSNKKLGFYFFDWQ